MQIQIDPNIPSNVPDEEMRDFQSFIQTALDSLTEAAGPEVLALGTGLFTGLALIVIVIAGVKIAFSGNIQPWEVVRLVIGIWIPWVMMQFYTTWIPPVIPPPSAILLPPWPGASFSPFSFSCSSCYSLSPTLR